jgi:AraC-like DNA-binding protein
MNLEQQSVRAAAADPDKDQLALTELAAILDRFAGSDGLHKTAIPGLAVYRSSTPHVTVCGIYEPSFTVVARGAKRVFLLNERYDYDESHCLVTSIDLPVVASVTRAAPEAPYLCLTLQIDSVRIADLMTETGLPIPTTAPSRRGIAARRLSPALLDASLRLARLLTSAEDIPILAPLIEREILYRLLTGEDGQLLRHIAVTGHESHQIANAIRWLRAHYAKPLRIENLARHVNISASSLHHHFKAITGMSPLQYQKRLRLHEARRLMLTGMFDAASASHQVGYESPSQFSREYHRLYGAPPLQDVAHLRADADVLQDWARNS